MNGCQQSREVGKVCKMKKNEIVRGVMMLKQQRWLNLSEVRQKVVGLVCG